MSGNDEVLGYGNTIRSYSEPKSARYCTLVELYTLFAMTLSEEQRTELRRQIFAEAGVSLGEERVAQDPKAVEVNTRRSSLHRTLRMLRGRAYLLLDPEFVRLALSDADHFAKSYGRKTVIAVHDDGALSFDDEQAWLSQPRSLAPFTVNPKE